MPPISLLIGDNNLVNQFVILRDPPVNTTAVFHTPQQAKDAGAIVMPYGVFLQAVINFFIVGLCLYVIVGLWSRYSEKFQAPAAPPATNTDPCPACLKPVDKEAYRW